MIRSSFILKENHIFFEGEDNPPDKVIIVEELDGIDIDGIENLMDLPRLIMFIDEKCGILKAVIDGG